MPNDRPNYYEILQIDEDTSNKDIRNAYRALVKQYHPDIHHGFAKKEAEEKLKLINEAYDCLSDAKRRKEYDKSIFINVKPVNPSTRTNDTNYYNGSAYTDTSIQSTKKSSYGGMSFHELNYYCQGQKTDAYDGNKDKELREKIFLMIKIVAILLVVTISILGGFFIDSFTKNNHDDKNAITQNTNDNEARGNNKIENSTEKYSIVPSGITFGDTKDKVRSTFGQPTSIGKDKWRYENSIIFFNKRNEVDGWDNPNGRLDLYAGGLVEYAEPIKINSSKKDVIRAMGTPNYLTKDKWRYGTSVIYFNSDDKVKLWDNRGNNLKVNPVRKSYSR